MSDLAALLDESTPDYVVSEDAMRWAPGTLPALPFAEVAPGMFRVRKPRPSQPIPPGAGAGGHTSP